LLALDAAIRKTAARPTTDFEWVPVNDLGAIAEEAPIPGRVYYRNPAAQ
jgi:hypothetical protein